MGSVPNVDNLRAERILVFDDHNTPLRMDDDGSWGF